MSREGWERSGGEAGGCISVHCLPVLDRHSVTALCDVIGGLTLTALSIKRRHCASLFHRKAVGLGSAASSIWETGLSWESNVFKSLQACVHHLMCILSLSLSAFLSPSLYLSLSLSHHIFTWSASFLLLCTHLLMVN